MAKRPSKLWYKGQAHGDRRRDIIEGFATGAFIHAWADAVDQLVEDGELESTPWGPGGAVDDHAPPTPSYMEAIAKREIARIERANDMSIEVAFDEALESDYDAPEDPNQFGWQLALSWLGTGSAFPDGLKDFDTGNGELQIEIPDPDNLDETELGYASGRIMTNGVGNANGPRKYVIMDSYARYLSDSGRFGADIKKAKRFSCPDEAGLAAEQASEKINDEVAVYDTEEEAFVGE